MTDFQPKVGLILGSGLGNYARNMKIICEIPYGDIPEFPVSTVEGHDGRIFIWIYRGCPGGCDERARSLLRGIFDGGSCAPDPSDEDARDRSAVSDEMPIRRINRAFHVGDFMMITDQISSFAPSPLIGENVSELGDRFPDMTHIYDLSCSS